MQPMTPVGAPLGMFSHILINSSAGKDSQAMTDVVVEAAERAGVRDRVLMVHCDLGRLEWPGTLELAREHAEHYRIPFRVVKREGRGDLLDEIRRRGRWPSSTERYCTSYYKRDQVARLYTELAREARKTCLTRPWILNCLGFRAEESPRRKKLQPWALNKRCSTGAKQVYDWLPIHAWPEWQVWDRIVQAGTRKHPAYDLGMKRLSCQFCIFAPRSQLMIAARQNPELWAEYVQAERDMQHTFRKSLSLVEVDGALRAGEQPTHDDDGAWDM